MTEYVYIGVPTWVFPAVLIAGPIAFYLGYYFEVLKKKMVAKKK